MFNNYKDVVTVKELCEMLDIGKNTAYTLLRSNVIKSIHIGRQLRIPKSSVVEFLEKTKE